MALTHRELAIFMTHWTGRKLKPACSVCGQVNWEPTEILAAPVSVRSLLGAAQESVPLLLLTCRNCFHALQFAWLPIEREHAPSRFPLTQAILRGETK